MRREDTDDDGTYDDEYFHLTDVQFSTVAIIDETAEIQERVTYDPYGKASHHHMGDVNGDGAITTSGAGSDYQTIIDIATVATIRLVIPARMPTEQKPILIAMAMLMRRTGCMC